LTYKFRLFPTKAQHRTLAAILTAQRHLYNGTLEHRIEAYRKVRRSISYFTQCKELTELRA